MAGSYRRAVKRSKLPRKVRLSLSIGIAVLLLIALFFLIRGCTATPKDKTEGTSTTTTTTDSNQPAQTDPNQVDLGLTDDASLDDAESTDQGETDDPALNDVGEQTVDLTNDLAPRVPSVPVGNRAITIRSVGDIVAHAPILKAAYTGSTYDFSSMFTEVAETLGKADYTVLNVDGPMGGTKYARYRGYPQFNTPPHLMLPLKDAGVDMLTLANNHALDTYFDGLLLTIKKVDEVGLAHIGAYSSKEEREKPYIVDIGGIQVGFLNYATATNNMMQRSDPKANEFGLRTVDNSNAPKDIKNLRDAGAEIVIVYMHWGEEYNQNVTNNIKKMAKTLATAGADAIIGGHQHVVLPCEWLTGKGEDGVERRTLVMYGMGNFLSDQRARYRDSGAIFEITIADNAETGKPEVMNPQFIPTYVHRTKNGNGFNYKVLVCGDVIDNPPSGMAANVLNRIKQVWNEQKLVMDGSPAQIAKN